MGFLLVPFQTSPTRRGGGTFFTLKHAIVSTQTNPPKLDTHMSHFRMVLVSTFCLAHFWCSTTPSGVSWAEEPATVSFRSHIAPILRDRCLACHSAKLAEGGYRVDSYQELSAAGDSGQPPLAGDGETIAELLRRLQCDASERMPLDEEPLAPEQIDQFKQWIAGGAIFDGEDPAQAIHLVVPPETHPAAPTSYASAIPVAAATSTPDGTQAIVGGYHELTVWNLRDGSLARRIGNLGQRTYAIDFSADGQTVAAACGEPGRSGEVRLIDFASGQVRGVVARAADVALDVAFRPGTDEIAIALADSSIRIVDSATLVQRLAIASHADWVNALAWSDDGARLASASRDHSSKVFDGATGELVATYAGHAAPVRGVALTADGTHVMSVGDDQKMHRWQVADGSPVAVIPLGSVPSRVARSGDKLFVPCADHRLLQLDLNENKISRTFAGHAARVLTVQAFSAPAIASSVNASDAAPNLPNEYLLSSSFDGQLRVWDVKAAGTGTVLDWLAKP